MRGMTGPYAGIVPHALIEITQGSLAPTIQMTIDAFDLVRKSWRTGWDSNPR